MKSSSVASKTETIGTKHDSNFLVCDIDNSKESYSVSTGAFTVVMQWLGLLQKMAKTNVQNNQHTHKAKNLSTSFPHAVAWTEDI